MNPSSIEVITPKRATEYLDRNHGNRKLREGVVERYAEDMKNGRWTQCVAPIVFYDNGDIADGQHRLWAIVESGKQQSFYVVRGLPREAGLNIDTGLGRSLVDNARISGIDPDLSNELIALTRAIEEGQRSSMKGISNSHRLAVANKHRDAAKWVLLHGPKTKGVRNACIGAAIARAWYVEKDKERLARFCQVLHSGFADGDAESAAVALRNMMLGLPNLNHTATFRDVFLKAQNAIFHFMRSKRLVVLKTIKDEVYPLKAPKVSK